MDLGVVFWVVMIIVFIGGLIWYWPRNRAEAFPFGSWVVTFLLLGMLGWRVFGPVIKG